MNYIADRLFALLLGWTRALFNGLWNLLTNSSAGAASFLQRFWLPIIVILLAFGTLADYLIWFIRWRPHYVWSAWLRQRGSKRRLNQSLHYIDALDHSPLDLPEYQQEADAQGQPAVMDEPIYFDFEVPWQQQMADQPDQMAFEAAQPEEPPQFVPHLPWENQPQAAWQPQEQEAHLDSEPPEQSWPPLNVQLPEVDVGQAHPPVNREQVDEAAPAAQAASSRRRRVDTRRQRGTRVLQSLRDTFFTSQDDLASIDSIKPPVSQDEAFHKPYYPQNYSYREQAAQQPPPPEEPQ
ncbi:MAG: hypothetical protein GXY84_08510 [Clostridiales bacterium]|nr:hypothetical protein [Clostridiales bacterium]